MAPNCGRRKDWDVLIREVAFAGAIRRGEWEGCGMYAMKCVVGTSPVEGFSGHSAALINEGRDEGGIVQALRWALYSGVIEGENGECSWICEEVLKVLSVESWRRSGERYVSIAGEISQEEGRAVGVKSEKVRWWCGE